MNLAYKVFGSKRPDASDWTEIEVEGIEDAKAAVITDVVNAMDPPQRYHAVMRCGDLDIRLEFDFDGEQVKGETCVALEPEA